MVQRTRRRELLGSIGILGTVGLAGCVESADEGGDDESDDESEDDGGSGGGETLNWWAGGSSGTYYPLSNEFKGIVEDATDYSLQVKSTGASVENVGGLASGEANFGVIQNDIASFALNGEGIDDFDGEPVENLRGVATLYPESITVVTQADSDIETLEDMEGARINTGDTGSGTQVDALSILRAVGIEEGDFEEENSGFGTASDQISNGDIDAAFVVGGYPVGAIEELAQSSDIRIIEISGETREAIKDEASFFADETIPGGTYEGVDEDVETVAVMAMIATREEESAEMVEAVTGAIFDNTDELSTKSDDISRDSAQEGMSIDLHEGAAAYFDE
ncbi:MAG: TAXI family TRAP transporter solute-binding subunit [Halohasta sp.]